MENSPVSRNKILDMIYKTCWDPNIINKEMIYKSFRITGITNSFNGQEDYLFTVWGNMQSENPIIENDIEEYNKDDFNDSGLEE